MSTVEGWRTKSLGAVIKDIGDGGTPNTNKKEYFGGTILWIVIQDIRKEISSSKTTLTPIGLDSCSAKLWPTGSVILSTGATIGEVGLAKVPVSTKQGIHGIVCGEELLSSFLYYKLQTLRDFLNANAQGSTIREVRATFLRTIPISFPTALPEQAKIAEILSTVDRAIEQTEALIAKQQRIKTGLMQDLLTRGIDEHGNLRSEQTHEFKDSPLGRIPVEWKVKKLDEITIKIADRDHTTPIYVEDGILIVSSMAFYDDESIDFKMCPQITEKAHELNSKKTDCSLGDIVLHRIGAGLGRVRVVTEDHPKYSILHSLALIRPNKAHVVTSFLKWSFRSFELQKQMVLGTQSIGVPDLGLDKIASLVFKVSGSLDEQKRIGFLLEENQKNLNQLMSNVKKLRSLKTALMQDLLTGKKRVTLLLNETEVASL